MTQDQEPIVNRQNYAARKSYSIEVIIEFKYLFKIFEKIKTY
jgi:hypothetical protein